MDLLAEGFKQAQQLTKKHGKTFYFASKLLDKEKQYASYCIYAICRLSDDSVDSDPETANDNLKRIKEKVIKSYSSETLYDPILLAFRHVIIKYKIPQVYFDDLLSGMDMDLHKNRYANFDELNEYCYKVAGVVGLIMIQIFGIKNDCAKDYAVNLGIAMQLTNILRDIKEDYQRNRIYLAQDELKQFLINNNYFETELVDEKFIKFMKFQIQRARSHYLSAEKGIKFITNKRSRLVVYAMSTIYGHILDEIEFLNYDIFNQRAHVSKAKKLKLLFKLFKEGKYKECA